MISPPDVNQNYYSINRKPNFEVLQTFLPPLLIYLKKNIKLPQDFQLKARFFSQFK